MDTITAGLIKRIEDIEAKLTKKVITIYDDSVQCIFDKDNNLDDYYPAFKYYTTKNNKYDVPVYKPENMDIQYLRVLNAKERVESYCNNKPRFIENLFNLSVCGLVDNQGIDIIVTDKENRFILYSDKLVIQFMYNSELFIVKTQNEMYSFNTILEARTAIRNIIDEHIKKLCNVPESEVDRLKRLLAEETAKVAKLEQQLTQIKNLFSQI